MPILEPSPQNDIAIRSERDGYEQGGLLYFEFEGREMVAVIRERKDFDKHLKQKTSLHDYVNSLVTDKSYGSAMALAQLLPKR